MSYYLSWASLHLRKSLQGHGFLFPPADCPPVPLLCLKDNRDRASAVTSLTIDTAQHLAPQPTSSYLIVCSHSPTMVLHCCTDAACSSCAVHQNNVSCLVNTNCYIDWKACLSPKVWGAGFSIRRQALSRHVLLNPFKNSARAARVWGLSNSLNQLCSNHVAMQPNGQNRPPWQC
eukprot:3816831-Amphidinium_carterae.1